MPSHRSNPAAIEAARLERKSLRANTTDNRRKAEHLELPLTSRTEGGLNMEDASRAGMTVPGSVLSFRHRLVLRGSRAARTAALPQRLLRSKSRRCQSPTTTAS